MPAHNHELPRGNSPSRRARENGREDVSKGNKGFGALLTEGLEDVVQAVPPLAGEGVLASRSQALARLATGKVVADRTEFIDPARCRPWRMHNRDLDHLNEESCRDLIDSFLAAKKQRLPAIVRRVRGEADVDYEIIAGVRRWWTVRWLREHHHVEFEYLVTIQSLTDEEAFRVSDLENRARKDITDWERAQEYSGALNEFYNGSQSEMAEHINVSKSWLSRMLDVARLPEPIVAAFSDRHDVTVRIARDLKPLTGDPGSMRAMATEAKAIVSARAKGEATLRASEVAKRLIAATLAPRKARAVRSAVQEYRSAADRPMLSVMRSGAKQGRVTLTLHPRSGADRAEILAAIEQLLFE